MIEMHDVPYLLVPFPARRLAKPVALLRNQEVDPSPDAPWLGRYAYCAPRDEADAANFLDEHKTFFSERYGGQGLLTNGGGARCGNDGRFQVKGIGPTPLVGRHTDFWYRHGGATLVEGIREVIWSRVLNQLLPYGACQISGLVDCNTESWRKVGGEKTLSPRCLIVREVAWRPAHFERSLYFVPTEEYAAHLPHDTERCRSATRHLADALPLPLGADRDDLRARGHLLLAGMTELADRFARQLSSAREHRIMHGGLSSSNIALDGRFIDFGSVSHLPGFANTRNFVPGFWDDQHALLSSITHTCLYLKKYQHQGDQQLPDPDWLIHRFRIAFHHFQTRSFFSLLGLPPTVQSMLERDHPTLVQSLGEALAGIARRGADRPYYGEPSGFSQHGRYRLKDAIVALLRTHGTGMVDALLTPIIDDALDRSTLIDRFQAIMPAALTAARTLKLSSGSLRLYAAITATRRLALIPELFGPNLDDDIAQAISSAKSNHASSSVIEALVSRRVERGLSLRRADDDRFAWMEDSLAGVVRFDAEMGVWEGGRAATDPSLLDGLYFTDTKSSNPQEQVA